MSDRGTHVVSNFPAWGEEEVIPPLSLRIRCLWNHKLSDFNSLPVAIRVLNPDSFKSNATGSELKSLCERSYGSGSMCASVRGTSHKCHKIPAS